MDALKVLCADDDMPILNNLKKFPWEKYGCHLAGTAADGVKALELFERLKPELVLADIRMPMMDGLTFIHMAKQIMPKARFIILSAHCDFEYARRAMRDGVMEYLTKGEFTDEELGKVLLRFTSPAEDHSTYRFEIEQTLCLMEAQLSEAISLESVAQQVGITPNYLGSLFYKQTGKRFRDHLNELRMQRAKELLLHSPLKIYEIAQQVGIQNAQYFSELFQKKFGVTPGRLRNKQ